MLRVVNFCGCPGRLSVVGGAPEEAQRCLLWRTDAQLIGRGGWLAGAAAPGCSLACEVAELYHSGAQVQLGELPSQGQLEVVWLELATDGSLLVLLKPCTASGLY